MLLEVSNLSISYGDHPIVDDVSLSLDEGKVIAIVGESGSGKTTVIRAILGCLPNEGRVTGGSIVFNGKDLLKNTPEEWRRISGRDISMVFQSSGSMMDPIQTIGKQFVEYIREHADMTEEEAAKQAVAMLARMNLPNPETIMELFPFELSGGMNQRVGVAMGMFFQPKLLLADEPTSALDVTTQAQVVEEMMGICRDDNTAIIIVTHNLGVAAYMADEIIVMRYGDIIERGTSEEIVDHPKEDYTKELLDAVPQIGDVDHGTY